MKNKYYFPKRVAHNGRYCDDFADGTFNGLCHYVVVDLILFLQDQQRGV